MINVARDARIPEPDDEAVTNAMIALDTNQDGTINVQEFQELVKVILEQIKLN